MRTIRRLLALVPMALLVAGCQRADRAISAPPTRAELFSLREQEPTLSILVGVERAGARPLLAIVPKYEDIEPTPEEREILGEKELPEPDVLAFYRPPRGPDHGVSTEIFAMSIGIGGIGGALVGHAAVYPRLDTHGLAGHYAFAGTLPRPGASVGRPRARIAEPGRAWTLDVGEGRPRQPARRAPRRPR